MSRPTPSPTPPPLHTPARQWQSDRARRAWCVLLALTALAVCLLAFDPHPPQRLDTGWDKGNHVLAFAALGALAELAFGPTWLRRRAAALGLLAFGAFIEAVQSTLPARSAEWPDLLADGAGIAIGMLSAAWVLRTLSRRRP